MDWTAILVAALGGGVLATLGQAFFHWLERRGDRHIEAQRVQLQTQELDIAADKVKIEEKHVDADAAHQIAGAFTQLVTELRTQQEVQRQEHLECQRQIVVQQEEIAVLQKQVRDLQAELYRVVGGHDAS